MLNGCYFSRSEKLTLHLSPSLTQQFLRLQSHQICALRIIDHGQHLEAIFVVVVVVFGAWEKVNKNENLEV